MTEGEEDKRRANFRSAVGVTIAMLCVLLPNILAIADGSSGAKPVRILLLAMSTITLPVALTMAIKNRSRR